MVKIRQAKLLVLMISLIILSGCAASEKLGDRYDAWREVFLSEPNQEITADVSFSGVDRVSDYSLIYTRSEDSETIEIIEPELISRVTAQIVGEKAELLFDSAVLETGHGITDGLSPMTSLPAFMDFIEEGYIESIGRETDAGGVKLIVSELELPDGSRMKLWQSEQSMEPVAAAIRSSDKIEARIKITKIN